MRKIRYLSPPILLTYAFLLVISVIAGFPVIYSIFGSFKPNVEFILGGARLLPREWRFENYAEAWELANFAQYTWNSLYVTIPTVILSLFFVSMAGYVFSRFRFPGRTIMLGTLLATMFLATGTVTLYPIYRVARTLGIHQSLWGLIVVYIFSTNAAFIYLIMGYLAGIPKEMDQAATIDGCSKFGIYWRIILPLSKPILATLGLLAFRAAWNDFMLPLVFTMARPAMRTLTVGVIALRDTRDGAAAWNLMLAGTTISLVPIVVIYLITNKYFIRGITAGSVKE